MTQSPYVMELTDKLNISLADTLFVKRDRERLVREKGPCQEELTIRLVKARVKSGPYAVTIYPMLSFTYAELNRLTCRFMGITDRRGLATGTVTLLSRIPGADLGRYKFAAGVPIDVSAAKLTEDFLTYGLSFYDRYDDLNKLQKCLEETADGDLGFRFNRPGSRDCCLAALYCAGGESGKLEELMKSGRLTQEQNERIQKWLDRHGPEKEEA